MPDPAAVADPILNSETAPIPSDDSAAKPSETPDPSKPAEDGSGAGKTGEEKKVEPPVDREAIRREIQAEQDRKRAQTEAEALAKARIDALRNLHQTERDSLYNDLKAEIDGALEGGRKPHEQFIARRINEAVARLANSAGESILLPVLQDTGFKLLNAMGDTPENRQRLTGKDIPGLIDEAIAYGRESGPENAVPKKEHERLVKEAVEKALDEFKAANPSAVSPSVGGKSDNRTREEILADPSTPLSEINRLLAEKGL